MGKPSPGSRGQTTLPGHACEWQGWDSNQAWADPRGPPSGGAHPTRTDAGPQGCGPFRAGLDPRCQTSSRASPGGCSSPDRLGSCHSVPLDAESSDNSVIRALPLQMVTQHPPRSLATEASPASGGAEQTRVQVLPLPPRSLHPQLCGAGIRGGWVRLQDAHAQCWSYLALAGGQSSRGGGGEVPYPSPLLPTPSLLPRRPAPPPGHPPPPPPHPHHPHPLPAGLHLWT